MLAWLVDISFRFGPAEYTALILLALAMLVALAPTSLCKATGMAIFGLLLGSINSDDASIARTQFGLALDGSVAVAAVIVFGLLLPRIAAYASQPAAQSRLTWPRMAYDALAAPETAPALLLMRQPWLPARWVVPLAVAWSALLSVYLALGPADLLLCACVFGAGLLFYQLDCPWPPLLVGVQLATLLDENLRRSLLLSRGDWSTFLTRPISLALLTLTVMAIAGSAVIRWRQHRKRVRG